MKIRTVVLAVTVVVLLVSTGASAHSGEHDPPAWYTVEQGVASGGGYHLAGLTWRVSGAASGGGYRLLGPAAPALRGNGCCCTWLPCVVSNQP